VVEKPVQEEKEVVGPAPVAAEAPVGTSMALRDNKKLARLRRKGLLDELKRELVEEVVKSCCAIANFNCCLDQPTPLSNDGAALVGNQLLAGCCWVHTLWLESNEIGPTGAKEIAKGLRVHKHITDLSLAHNPIRQCLYPTGAKNSIPHTKNMLTIRELAGTEGLEYIGKALADGTCPIFTLNIKDTQVFRLPSLYTS
jgi:hypothetical protein